MFDKSSSHQVVNCSKSKGSDQQRGLQGDIGRYSDERLEEHAMVVSCEENFAKELFTSMGEDYLVVDNVDLNTKSFSKQLGNLFLCDSMTLFMETTNLSKTGKKRLLAIVQGLKTLFDNRVRVILYGKSTCESVSEKRFVCSDRDQDDRNHESFNAEIVTGEKYKAKSDTIFPKEFYIQELEKCRFLLNKALQESQDSNQKIENIQHEVKDIKEELANAMKDKEDIAHKLTAALKEKELVAEKLNKTMHEKEAINEDLAHALREKGLAEEMVKKALEEKEHAHRKIQDALNAKEQDDEILSSALQERDDYCETVELLEKDKNEMKAVIENLENSNLALTKKMNNWKRIPDDANESAQPPPVTSHPFVPNKPTMKQEASQTKKVELTPSSLSTIVSNLDASKEISMVDKVFRCVKNFTCNVINMKEPNGMFHCQVKVTKGKHILENRDLIDFEAKGATMEEAKEAAFNLFVDKLKNEAEK